MNPTAIPLAPTRLTLGSSVCAATIAPATWLLWQRRGARVLLVGWIVLTIFFLTIPFAGATDRILINESGCQVTQEDASGIGIYYQSNLYLDIDFPNSHWRFGLRNDGLKGLSMVDVGVQAAQFTSKQYIIKKAGLADVFVLYDDRSHKYYDLDYDNAMDQIDPADLPSQNAALVYLRTQVGTQYVQDRVPRVAVECREAGMGWLCKQPGNHMRRRIHDVVVWGVYDAGNYDYIIQYTFHEDGGISLRAGATGYNLPSDASEPHVHNPLWRVSTKLFDRLDNQAFEWVHVEDSQGLIATDSDWPIPTVTSSDWDPEYFSRVRIQSATQTNDYGHLMGYEFLPGDRTGTGRFSTRSGDKEMWTQHDQYVTNDDPGDDGSGTGYNNWLYTWITPDDYLLSYLNGEPVGGTGDGVVLWYVSSVHHEPTDSDNQQGNGNRTGITLMHWSGFDIEPHNMFDYNPLGGPPRCGS
jgi:primary-amine oxidase